MKMGNLERMRRVTEHAQRCPAAGQHYQQSLCFFFVTAVLAPSGTLVYERNHRAPLTWKLAERGL